jgi:hypothetical protein
MAKQPVASTRTLCQMGALLHAVRLIHRNWEDERIAKRLDDVYSCGTHDQYLEIIRIARQGVRAADLLVELDPEDKIDAILIPHVPE